MFRSLSRKLQAAKPSHDRVRPFVGLEPLEQRTLMAFVANIDFRAPTSPADSSYTADVGQFYRRQNGYTYGFTSVNSNFGHTPSRRASQYLANSYNTLYSGNDWQISVPNGLYNVYLSVGQADRVGSNYRINVEGMRIISGTPTSSNRFLTGLVTVRVLDGKLTLSNTGRGRDNRINFINILDASPAALAVQSVGNSSVQLSWRDFTLYQSGVKVERSSDGQTFQQIANIAGPAVQQFVDNDAAAGADYVYRVQNYTYLGDSNFSPPANITTPEVTILASAYGAVGNGINDDAPAIQAAIDAAPVGATVLLEPNLTYLLGTGLGISKGIDFNGRNAKLVLNQSNYPRNTTIRVFSDIDFTTPDASWTQAISAGQSTFNVATNTSRLRPGDWIEIFLGQDPYDPNESHFGTLVKIVANTGTSITIDRAVPYDISQGNFQHRIFRVNRLAANGSIKNLRFDRTSTSITDQTIALTQVRDFLVEGISGIFPIAVQSAYSSGITIRNVRGELDHSHQAAGRVLNLWQTDNVVLSDVIVSTSADRAVVFIESHARNTVISDITINWNLPTEASNNVFHLTGGSTGIRLSNVTVNNVGNILLVDGGGQPADYFFTNTVVTGNVRFVPLERFDNLTIGSTVFNASKLRTLSLDVNITPNMQGIRQALFSGVVRSVKARVNSLQGIAYVMIIGDTGNGVQFAPNLVANQEVFIWGPNCFGTQYVFNQPPNINKLLSIVTDGTVLANTSIHLDIEYYLP